jgi:transmembrane sensor
MNYFEYNVEDFSVDDYFKNWVLFPNQENEAFWQKFLDDYPEKYYIIQESRILVAELYHINQTEISQDHTDAIWQRIDTTIQEERNSLKFLNWINFRSIAASVSLTAVLSMLWYFYSKNATNGFLAPQKSEIVWQEVENHQPQVMEIKLSDGSTVHLQKNSKLKYPKSLSDSPVRQVVLEGVAKFDIHKDPERPFLVYAQGLVTKVLGTSFVVKALPNDTKVTVSVNSGKVSLYSNQNKSDARSKTSSIVLTPNQQAVFEKKTTTFSKSVVENPAVIEKSRTLSFNFKNTPATQIFKNLEEAYGIEVLFDEDIMAHCKLNIDVTQEDLYEKLNVICKVLNAKFEMIDAKIIIYSNGC